MNYFMYWVTEWHVYSQRPCMAGCFFTVSVAYRSLEHGPVCIKPTNTIPLPCSLDPFKEVIIRMSTLEFGWHCALPKEFSLTVRFQHGTFLRFGWALVAYGIVFLLAFCHSIKLIYEGRSKSFATQYDAQISHHHHHHGTERSAVASRRCDLSPKRSVLPSDVKDPSLTSCVERIQSPPLRLCEGPGFWAIEEYR